MHIRGRYQHARFVAVIAPAIGSHVLYLEWRNGGPEGAILRQRISSFRVLFRPASAVLWQPPDGA